MKLSLAHMTLMNFVLNSFAEKKQLIDHTPMVEIRAVESESLKVGKSRIKSEKSDFISY